MQGRSGAVVLGARPGPRPAPAHGERMADKPAAATEKKPAQAEEKKAGAGKGEAKGKGGGGVLTKTPVVIGAVMLVEAVVLFAGFKFLGGGPRNAGAEVTLDKDAAVAAGGEKGDHKATEAGKDHKDTVEVPVVDIRAPNKQSGRTFLYDVSIFAVTKSDAQDKAKDLISSREALIKDRVRTIIAEMDPDKLGGGSEPGLETLRRQVKFQLDDILGDGLVIEVLVPRCMPFRTDY
jgi:flagellar basal body-associated protein FliL